MSGSSRLARPSTRRLDEVNNRPSMVNAGAMAAAELIRGDSPEARIATMLEVMSRFAGRSLHVDESVFRSEQATGNRNRAIAYMMLNAGMIHSPPEAILDIYFRQCAVRVTCTDLAVMAASRQQQRQPGDQRAHRLELHPDVHRDAPAARTATPDSSPTRSACRPRTSPAASSRSSPQINASSRRASTPTATASAASPSAGVLRDLRPPHLEP